MEEDSSDDGVMYIQESHGDDDSYRYSFAYEKATLYEFKFERAAEPDPIDPCFRCNRQVPRDDQVQIGGALFHRQCFRCRICGLPLTVQTFCRNDPNGSRDREVYCRSHVGKQISELKSAGTLALENNHPAIAPKARITELDDDLEPNKTNYVTPSPKVSAPPSAMVSPSPTVTPPQKAGTSTRRPLPPPPAKGSQRRPQGQRSGLPAPPAAPVQAKTPPPRTMTPPPRKGTPPPRTGTPPRPGSATPTSMRYSPASSSITTVSPYIVNNNDSGTSAWTSYSPLTLDQTASITGTSHASSMKSFSHPRPVLQSYDDFENSGVFEAQPLLEQRHRDEEERLQRFLQEEREKESRRLDETLQVEKERAAAELLASLEKLPVKPRIEDLKMERDRIDEYFNRQREERLRLVTDRIGAEEKARTNKMLDRHCLEMMTLIAEKDREADSSLLYERTMRPPIEPPETKKSGLYKSPAVFEELDTRALQISKREYDTLTELVRDLTKGCRNELEKVRVLFRWTIAKDLNKHNVTDVINPSAASPVLKGVKSGKETFHQLFRKLCCYAGLHCEIVLGYSKGAGYKPGMRMEGDRFRNAWTAVCVDGSWRLINCTWAARHVSGHKDDLPQIFHRYDEFYFLTDPEDYIYQHYPDDAAWQLLDIPLPFSEFLNLPLVKSPFFNYGLKFFSNYGATLESNTGMVEVRLIMPKILTFGCTLEPVERAPNEPSTIDGRCLVRFVKNEAIFTMALPRKGLFYMSIFTGDYFKEACLESAAVFLINCTKLAGPPSPPYPPVPVYGPTPVLEKLGLSVNSHLDPLIVCNNEMLEVSINTQPNVKVTHTFQYFEVSDESICDVDRHVFPRSRSDKEANYLVRCPKEGFYILSLYAGESGVPGGEDEEDQALDCAFRYLVICQESSPASHAFPKTYPKWQRCTLYEPLHGDLVSGKRVNFRLEVPHAVEVFVVVGEVWHHLKRRLGFAWEGGVNVGGAAGTVKVMARFQAGRDMSIFAHLLDYQVVEDVETEI